jgi:hypothetical protein
MNSNLQWRLSRNKLAPLVVGLIAALSFWVGGVLLTAMILVLAAYLGVLISLSRVPDPNTIENTKLAKLIAPLYTIKKFLFRHNLILTILVGLFISSLVNISTVLGMTTIILCLLLGDFIIIGYKEGYRLVMRHELA